MFCLVYRTLIPYYYLVTYMQVGGLDSLPLFLSLSLLSPASLLFDTVRYDIIRYSPADPKSRWGRHSPTLSPHETRRPTSVSFFFFFSISSGFHQHPDSGKVYAIYLLPSSFCFLFLSSFYFIPCLYHRFLFSFLFPFSYNCKLPTHTFKRSNSAPEGFGITKISYSISTS